MNIVRLGVMAVVALSLVAATPTVGAEEPQDRARVAESTTVEHHQATLAEREYRHRLAKLRRLSEIAARRNDTDRLAEIDELSERLRWRHAERISRLKRRMDGPATRRLDEELASGRDRAEWVHEHREKARELRTDQREKQQDARQARHREKRDEHQTRHDRHMENREQRFDTRQAKRQDKFDKRVEHRQDRREHRSDAHRQRHDKRVEHHQDRREHRSDVHRQRHDNRVEHRQDRREHRSEHRREVRGADRDRAEQKWSQAREMADRSRNKAVGSRLEQRWREEADGRGAERWERAARSRGMLSNDRSARGFRMPSQREADADMSTRISAANAEAEFERLRREINR